MPKEFTITELVEMTKDLLCVSCQKGKVGAVYRIYPHDSGVRIQGYSEKQWFYTVCQHCGYGNSLFKLIHLNKKWATAKLEWYLTKMEALV